MRYIALAIAAGLALLLVRPTHATGSHCDVDPTADRVVDISDVALLTAAFGTNVPHLDIIPELAPNGYVDISDVSAVTGHFGEGCYGSVGVESDPFSFITGCRYKASGFTSGSVNGYAFVREWGGKSLCDYTPGAYTTFCRFTFERYTGSEWVVAANTTDTYVGGTFCSAQGLPAFLPLYHRYRGVVEHIVWRDGAMAHGPHRHAEQESWSLP